MVYVYDETAFLHCLQEVSYTGSDYDHNSEESFYKSKYRASFTLSIIQDIMYIFLYVQHNT